MSGLLGWLRAWRVPLRLARRDALRSRGRSALVLVMIALPVLGVTAADVLISTTDVSAVEGIDRTMGSAQALVRADDGSGPVLQGVDPDGTGFSAGEGGPTPDAAELSAALGGARLLELRRGEVSIVTDRGQAPAEVTEVDLADPLADGLFDLDSGRLPTSSDEVVVNQALLDKGYAVGDTLQLDAGDVPDGAGLPDGADGPDESAGAGPTIVGVAESTAVRTFPVVAGPVGSIGLSTEGSRSWLAGGGPVSWSTVEEVNALGAYVTSRSVVTDPPPDSELPGDVVSTQGPDAGTLSAAVLVVVMALIEVVLLAGPAFAVGARRQSRSLALMAAAGGTPTQARRVVMGSAVVLGGVGAAAGVVLGIAVAAVALPVVQGLSSSYLGPFQVPWLQLLAIAAFGLVSALIAAVVPARIASRQDVVAVLAGRRGDQAPSRRSPLVGVALVGAGVAGAAFGATRTSGGETFIAGSAIFAVLGMILLVPVVLAALARVSGRLPLVVRYAARDAARHRTRTVPAVAAVAATVAGVVALGIGTASDAAEARATYLPATTAGVGVLTSYGSGASWAAYRSVLDREVPDATVTEVRGAVEYAGEGEPSSYVRVKLPGDREPLLSTSLSALGAGVLVSDDELPPGLLGVSAAEAARASATLRAGGAVVLTDRPVPAGSDQVLLLATTYASTGDGSAGTDERVRVPATFVQVGARGEVNGTAQAVVPTQAMTDVGVPVATVGLALSGTEITPEQEDAVTEGVAAISSDTSFVVERGYQADETTLIFQLVLAAIGGILMLGGTLTATFLALSDARPDLATLAAVGASPRTRRGVAGAYAVVVGGVGALLGAVIGFIPGIAVAFPLTRASYGFGEPTGPFLDIPWLLILGLVVALPLLTALVVALAARSRLPLAARLQ